MSRATAALVAAAIASVALPVAVWWLAAQLDLRRIVPLPFGDLRLVVVQAIAVLPLAWAIAKLLPTQRLAGVLAVLAALAMIAAGPWWAGKFFEELTKALEPGIFEHDRARAALLIVMRAMLLLAPAIAWLYGARCWQRHSPEKTALPSFVIAAMVVLVPPAIYSASLVRTLQQEAVEFLGESRRWRAWQRYQAVESIAPVQWHNSLLWRRLGTDVAREANLALSLSKSSNPKHQLRAVHGLLLLDELDAAEELLARIDDSKFPKASAHLHLMVAARRERWDEIIARIDQPRGEPVHGLRMNDAELLAMAHRGNGDWPAAEQIYRDMLEKHPQNAARWHYNLGRHYQLSGRVRLAKQEYEKVLTGHIYHGRALAALRELRMTTPTCMFGRGR